MDTFSKEIITAAYEHNINISSVDDICCNKIVSSLCSKYVSLNGHSAFMWDDLADSAFVNDINGWNKIKSFVDDNPCILIISEGGKEKAFNVVNGSDLDLLLGNTFSFEFYITNNEFSYLICFNHHDQLIGCGSAKKWINSICK